MHRCLTLIAALLPAAAPLAAQTPARDTIRLQRLAGTITLDGRPDEAAWQAVTPFAMVQFTPTEGVAPMDSSEIRVAYDDRYLYAAARMFVDDPSHVRPGNFTRDQLGGEDHFMLVIDSYGDERTGMVFSINPAGGLTDHAMGGDGASVDVSWNAYWDGASARDARGWYAELRIPLSTLRFQTRDGDAIMGLIIHRRNAWRNGFDTYPRLSSRHSAALFRASIAQTVALEDVEARTPVYLTPYVMGGLTAGTPANAAGTAYEHVQDATREAGADLKMGLTSNMTLAVTVNTDFAQVEADNQQVNLTRFSLFFPERRQFFLERSDLFAFATSDIDASRLFHSRRIGLSSAGAPLRIFGGARLVGRTGGTDIGVVTMQTRSGSGAGSDNASVVRLRRSVGRGSYVGAMVTSLAGAQGTNIVYAADAVVRPFGNEQLTAQWGQSFDTRTEARGTDAALAHVAWERRALRGLSYFGGLAWSGPAFNPVLGFQARRDVSTARAMVRWGWYPGTRTAFANVVPSLAATAVRRNSDHTDDSRSLTANVSASMKSGLMFTLGAVRNYENLHQALQFSPAAGVPAGAYAFDNVTASVMLPTRRTLTASASLAAGRYYDGHAIVAAISPAWIPSAHLQFGADLQLNRVRFPSRGQSFDAHVLRLRTDLARDNRLSASTFVQYNTFARSVVANARLRYHFAEGSDLWVVYNDLLDTDRGGADEAMPVAPLSVSRTLVLKYTHTLSR